MFVMGLTTAVGAVNVLTGGTDVDVVGVNVSATSHDVGEGLELAELLEVLTAGATSAALLATELGMPEGPRPGTWKGWVRPPRGSAAPILCLVAASDASPRQSMPLNTVVASVNTLSCGMGIDVTTLRVVTTCASGHAPVVHADASDVISARILAGDLDLSRTDNLTWGGTIRPARDHVRIPCIVTVHPTSDFLAGMAGPGQGA